MTEREKIMNFRKRIIAMVLAMLIVCAPIFAVYAENNPIYGEADGIQNGGTYIKKTQSVTISIPKL